MNKTFNYVAIPASDFNRAFAFYDRITDGLIKRNPNVPFPMAYFYDKEGNETGHLFQLPNFSPSSDGTIVYIQLGNDLNETLAKIEKAGGKTVMPKTLISATKGYWALFLDSEGNKLALHSTD